jgi:hypothetical protein
MLTPKCPINHFLVAALLQGLPISKKITSSSHLSIAGKNFRSHKNSALGDFSKSITIRSAHDVLSWERDLANQKGFHEKIFLDSFEQDPTGARTGSVRARGGAHACAPTMMVGPIGEAFAPPRGVRAPYDGACTI